LEPALQICAYGTFALSSARPLAFFLQVSCRDLSKPRTTATQELGGYGKTWSFRLVTGYWVSLRQRATPKVREIDSTQFLVAKNPQELDRKCCSYWAGSFDGWV